MAILAVLTVQSTQLLAAEVININQASAAVLAESISGIGPVKAQAIVDYRNANGEFSSLSELLSVPGIGQSLFERIRLGLSASDSTDQASAQVSATVPVVGSDAMPSVKEVLPVN